MTDSTGLRPIKVLHVFSRMMRGGAEMRALEMLRHVDRRQHQLHFCALSGLPGELDGEIRALGSEVHLLRRGRVGFARRFRALLRRHRFDVVQSQVLYYSGAILRLAAQCGAPIRVAHLQNSHHGRRAGPARRLLYGLMRHWINRYATQIVGVSEGVMVSLWGPQWRSDPRRRVIYNGVEGSSFDRAPSREEVRREFGFPPDVLLCIHVGSMSQQKNHLRLVSVFAEVSKRRSAARLLLVGQGDRRIERRVKQRVAQLGIEGAVVFCGGRTDVPRLLSAADVLILPSLWEGLPGVVQEACVAGTPVVASDLPGAREIASRLPGVRLVPLGVPDRQWAQAVERILASRESNVPPEKARQAFAASPFTIERFVENHCRIWRDPALQGAAGGIIDG